MEGRDVLRITLWPEERLSALGSALASPETQVTYADRGESERRLLAGLTDLALIPPDRAAELSEKIHLVPAVAYSTWSTPHASIALKGGFEARPSHIACADPASLEAFVSRVILKEHYGIIVEAEPLSGPASTSQGDAVLAVDEDPPAQPGVALDLGQEWYELTNYPMVWGVFAMRQGEVSQSVVRILREATARVETGDHLDGTDPEDEGFGLPRFRLDQVAIASLTELCTHLYFHGATDELREIEFVHMPEDAAPDDDTREPQL